MPTYHYTHEASGETIHVTESIEAMLTRMGLVEQDGKQYLRDIASEQRQRSPVKCTNWPLRSDALGVHPAQRAEREALLKSAGCPTEFDRSTGEAILTGPGHRRAVIRAMGMRERNAFC